MSSLFCTGLPMQNLSISFLGKDGPGIVATVSSGLRDNKCNIIQLTQSILGAEFAAIFIVQAPDGLAIPELQASLEKLLEKDRHDISVLIRTASSGSFSESTASEPYVVTTDGPDGPGLISAMTRVFARHNINIENIKAVLGHGGEDHALFVLEVQVPVSVDIGRLRRELHSVGKDMGLNTSVQHRDIFEAMHRIADF